MKRIVLPLLFLVACDRPRQPQDRAAAPSGPGAAETDRADGETLTVISYNVNYGLASCRRGQCTADPETLKVLQTLDADLLLLQETTEPWERVLRELFEGRFDHATFHDPTTSIASGIGAFSKHPISDDQLLPSPVGWFPANRMVVTTKAGPLEVLNVHLRPMVSESGSWISGYFTTDHFRKTELDAYKPKLHPSMPTLVAGDFNEDVDGEAFGDLLGMGFESALAAHAPDETTWRWNASGVPLALRLDHVAYEKSAFELVRAEVIQGGKSDHLPVKVTLRRRGA